ncbi:MAG TPA: carboxypeptidase regulatory-like domain-containing protein [Anaerolineae bacterium]|nr:carboxypeptidase regulatory-like domain-containing protein [Anaerolineae bacterium]
MSSKRRRGCWWWAFAVGLLVLIGVAVGWPIARRSPAGRAALNVAEYRLRTLWTSWLGSSDPNQMSAGAMSGVVLDPGGSPIPDALVLVASTRGKAYHSRSDELGVYRIEGVPAGRYVPVASKWGYDDEVYRLGRQERSLVTVDPGQLATAVDFVLSKHQPWEPDLATPVEMGPPQTGAALFPSEVHASRVPITFTNDGLVITTTLLYEPPGAETPSMLPVLVASYPSEPLNWDRVSVAMANEGFVVLAAGPSPRRGLDIPGMARDLLKAIGYLRNGQLTAHADIEREGWLSGSFSSIILYQALRENPGGVDALVIVGGISDGLLGVQSLYDEDLQIPENYATAIAALGRPDRYPEVYLGYSPAYHADHLPPVLVVHTTGDEVIPYSQAERFAEVLEAAGVTHELFLYGDTTHYLDQVNITPDTAELYRRLTAFLNAQVRQSGN